MKKALLFFVGILFISSNCVWHTGYARLGTNKIIISRNGGLFIKNSILYCDELEDSLSCRNAVINIRK